MSTEEIIDQLSECYNKHQPVLLYNDTSNKRNNLILTTHISNEGDTKIVRYIGSGEEAVFLDGIAGELNEWQNTELKKLTKESTINNVLGSDKAESDRVYKIREKIRNKVRDNFQSTKKSWKYLDCNGENSESVYTKLINDEPWREVRIPSVSPAPVVSKYSAKTCGPVTIQGSYLFDFKGTLFVDNLKYNKKDIKDVEGYCNLVEEIKKNNVSVHWLVVYFHNCDFPDSFLDQFIPISLEEKNVHIEDALANQVEIKSQKVIPFAQKDIIWEKVKWKDIKMVISEKTREIDISVGDKRPLNYQYSQMGFKYLKKNIPTKAWLVFMCLAKADNNTLNYKMITNATKYMKLQAFQDRMREIRNNIKSVFPELTGDPIPHNEQIGYKPLFRLYIIANSTSSIEVDQDDYGYQSKTIVKEQEV